MWDWIKEHFYVPIILGVLLIAGILLYLGLHTTDIQGKVLSKEWVRTIYIEKYDWVHHSKEGRSAPEGAINIKRWTETEHYTVTDEDGNKQTKTKWVDHISYDVQEWTYSREVVLRGVHPEVPEWPTYVLGRMPMEREGSRREEYTISIKILDKIKKFHPEREEYERISNREEYICKVNGFGAIRSVVYE